MALPYPGMDFTAFDTLPAADLDKLVANIEALEDGSAPVTAVSLATTALANPYKFSVYRNSAWTSGAPAKVQFDTELFDTNNNFDSSTNYRYTAPVTGFYQFNAAATAATNGGAGSIIYLYKNGSVIKQGNASIQGAGLFDWTGHVSALLSLTAGDYIEVYFYNGGAGSTGQDKTWFNGFLVSKT